MMTDQINKVGVLGAGSMGSGIVQIAATNKHQVILVDLNEEALTKIQTIFNEQLGAIDSALSFEIV